LGPLGEEVVPLKIQDSTLRALLLVVIVCESVSLVLALMWVDPPLSYITAGGFAVAVGSSLVVLRKTPRQTKRGL
jgi:hypothetical protein